MMKDLVLECKGGQGQWNDQNVQVILPNIGGQRYVFGSVYPGDEREGEEFFIFRRNYWISLDSTQFVIRVDELGQYWIQSQSETTKFKTFVNSEALSMEPRLLKIGDIVFLENGFHPSFLVKERIVPGSDQEIEGADSDLDMDIEACKTIKELVLAESPLDNSLVLEKIMSYLPFKDLKNARLVSKTWKDEASKAIEKRGKVSFTFGGCKNPEYSTRVCRYLHEMKGLKIRNLRILLSPSDPYQRSVLPLLFSPGGHREKMLDDIRKLLKSSHNFSTLVLSFERLTSMEIFPFQLILQELCEKLVELELRFCSPVFPVHLPQLPVLTNLKKFAHIGHLSEPFSQKWVSHFVPLFSNSLEQFTSFGDNDQAEPYLQEFLNHPTPNLKRISLKDKANVQSLSALLELGNRLTSLEVQYSNPSTELEELLEELFLKNSESLQHLVISIGNNGYHHTENTTVNFPPFPKLEELELEYDQRTRISWDYETSLDYEDHFPSLRKLTVRPLDPWREDDHVFNAFFRRRELRCETVKELWIPVLPNPMLPLSLLYVPFAAFQRRMNQIRKMFPNAGNINFFK